LRFLSQKFKMTVYIRLFGLFKVPMIYYCKPKVIDINQDAVTVKISLNRRTKNHVGSMYLGALSVGADITSAMLALELIKESNKKIIPIFKDFHADYFKRAEGDVHFVCTEGEKIRRIVKEVEKTNQRINEKIVVNAYVFKNKMKEHVAGFSLTLSLKAY